MTAADKLVNSQGHINTAHVALNRLCVYDDKPGRAKCEVFENLGRAWHPIEDFYSHSNWADQADTTRKIGVDNPPGLHQKGVPAFFGLRAYSRQAPAKWKADAAKAVDPKLTTGCVPGEYESDGTKVENCNGRIAHYDTNGKGGLSKDGEGSSRSKIAHNYQNARNGAINDIERQWKDFQGELLATYASNGRGKKMICALTHDAPTDSTCS
ncbi:hypothetical protein ACH4OW_09560 [Streptomyces sp. NPDC017056]|uniref:hypothetical protein n=1 Tax=Streptomyces sp. NPDC017056 TaxID=3364973 RepID=UPI00379591E5